MPKMRSINVSRDLLPAESIAFMTTANSKIAGIAKRGTPTIDKKSGTLADCAKIIEYPSATPLLGGLFPFPSGDEEDDG